MTDEIKIPHNDWQDDLISYHPITVKIRSLIASQLIFTEKASTLQDNATLISRCIGTVPKNQFEQDWKDLVTALLKPGQVLVGIGACIGPNDVNSAVKEALSDPDMDRDQIRTCSKIVVGIFGGADIPGKTVERIVNMVSRVSGQDIDSKVILFDEMQDIIAVLIMC